MSSVLLCETLTQFVLGFQDFRTIILQFMLLKIKIDLLPSFCYTIKIIQIKHYMCIFF